VHSSLHLKREGLIKPEPPKDDEQQVKDDASTKSAHSESKAKSKNVKDEEDK
jgi:hypothetical protein